MMTAIAQCLPEKIGKRLSAANKGMGISRLSTRHAAVEHPGRHFKPRSASEPLNVQRKMTSSALSTAS